MSAQVDILIPTFDRPAGLAVTLTSLAVQTFQDFRVVISDQGEGVDAANEGEVSAIVNLMRAQGHAVEIFKHLPRRGMAEQRHFLLSQASAPYSFFIDDDLALLPWVVGNLVQAIQQACCGLVGNGVIGLRHLNDHRPEEQKIEFWDGPVQPEQIHPYTPAWERHRLHSAANIYHVQQNLGITPDQPRLYKIGWIGACVLYDTEKLRSVGGFDFWRELPTAHAGEDVLAQWRVMARYGGAGVIPSGVYHLELPTTIPDRDVDAPYVLEVHPTVSTEEESQF